MTNHLIHFDMLVSNTANSKPLYSSLFPSWQYTDKAPTSTEIDTQGPDGYVKGGMMQKYIKRFVPFFKVDTIDQNFRQALANNECSIVDEGLHPLLRRQYLVFVDPDGIYIGVMV